MATHSPEFRARLRARGLLAAIRPRPILRGGEGDPPLKSPRSGLGGRIQNEAPRGKGNPPGRSLPAALHAPPGVLDGIAMHCRQGSLRFSRIALGPVSELAR
jgi:hypothetical protein